MYPKVSFSWADGAARVEDAWFLSLQSRKPEKPNLRRCEFGGFEDLTSSEGMTGCQGHIPNKIRFFSPRHQGHLP